MSDAREVYLGDGLYASFDGYMIMLLAPREDGDHCVGLEPPVFASLADFAKRCWSEKISRQQTTSGE